MRRCFCCVFRAFSFFTSLFDQTAAVIQGDLCSVARPENIPPIDIDGNVAAVFRAYMNAEATIAAHGKFRTKFSKEVIKNAEGKVC